MNPLDRFEGACERLVEGSIGRLFGSRVQPAEIGRKLEKVMAAAPVISIDRTIVPNDFSVSLHPDDFAHYASYAPALAAQLATWLDETARDRRWSVIDRVQVRIASDFAVRRREIRVAAAVAMLSPLPPDPVADAAANPGPPLHSPFLSGVRLKLLTGPQSGRTVLVRPPGATVGRAPDNDLVLQEDDVSRYHARLEIGPAGTRLIDLGSTNGSSLNGQPVTRARFGPGDRLGFGSMAVDVLGVTAPRSASPH